MSRTYILVSQCLANAEYLLNKREPEMDKIVDDNIVCLEELIDNFFKEETNPDEIAKVKNVIEGFISKYPKYFVLFDKFVKKMNV